MADDYTITHIIMRRSANCSDSITTLHLYTGVAHGGVPSFSSNWDDAKIFTVLTEAQKVFDSLRKNEYVLDQVFFVETYEIKFLVNGNIVGTVGK